MPLCSAPDKTIFTLTFYVKLTSGFRLLKDILQCGFIITVRTTSTVLNNPCSYVHVDKYSIAHLSANQLLILLIQPASSCCITRVNTNRPISLTIRQKRFVHHPFDLFFDDYMVVTEYHVNYYRTKFGHPVAVQLKWLPYHKQNYYFYLKSIPCSWKLGMLIQEDTHLDLMESISHIEDTGLSITSTTDFASHAFNISYTRKLKKHIMRKTENKNLTRCFHQRCYIGFGSYDKNVSWQEAHDLCQSSGHHLLSINSETEWLSLAKLLFYESSGANTVVNFRCSGLVIIFLGLRNQMVGITCCNITTSVLKCYFHA